MGSQTLLLAGLLALVVVVPARPAVAPGAGHYLPTVDDRFSFQETIALGEGRGNYTGYSETDAIVGTVTITATAANLTETASYAYSGSYANSAGTSYPWSSSGTFTFSAATYDYVQGTDDQPGYNDSGEWFYMNSSLGSGGGLDPLNTPMTVESTGTSYPLDTAAGTEVRAIYAVGTGTYERDDVYGVFSATYDWRAYYDPGTGYIVGYNYTELDADAHGDGFVYTDDLEVTKTSYTLTPAATPQLYTVAFSERGLATGTPWTVTFDGTPASGTSPELEVHGVQNGTYLYVVNASGYSVSPGYGFVTVTGPTPSTPVNVFTAVPSTGGSPVALVEEIAVVVVVLVVLVLIVYALARRRRSAPPLPRHSATGRPQYGTMPPGAPPPISLGPRDQPQIQQVVVKEVVKVNCRYCGSLIDSTAEKCPFCGATRT